MHVAVFADMEGSFGIWRKRQCHSGTPEWQYGRECLTEDVNQVIRGAFDGGADKVTVKDTHDTGFNCLRERLDSRAAYVGGHYTKPTLFGAVPDYDLVLYVAIHAASGTPDAFFPHTHSGVFARVSINQRRASEMDIYGGYLGEFGIPIGFFSGEEVAVQQALASLPWAESVLVDKRKEAYTAGQKSLEYLGKGRRELREKAAAAVKGGSGMKPLVFEGPLHFEAEFRSEKLARKHNTWRFPREGAIVRWEAENMLEGFDLFNKLAFFPRSFYPFLKALLFAMRTYHRIKSSRFAPEPRREGGPMAH